jgi:hypothetical protein
MQQAFFCQFSYTWSSLGLSGSCTSHLIALIICVCNLVVCFCTYNLLFVIWGCNLCVTPTTYALVICTFVVYHSSIRSLCICSLLTMLQLVCVELVTYTCNLWICSILSTLATCACLTYACNLCSCNLCICNLSLMPTTCCAPIIYYLFVTWMSSLVHGTYRNS